MTHRVYLLPFLGYLAGYKSVFARPSDLNMMTNSALEATASWSVKMTRYKEQYHNIDQPQEEPTTCGKKATVVTDNFSS